MRTRCETGEQSDQRSDQDVVAFAHDLSMQDRHCCRDHQCRNKTQSVQASEPAGSREDDFRQPFFRDDRLTRARMRKHIGADDLPGLEHVLADAPMHARVAVAGDHRGALGRLQEHHDEHQPQPVAQRRHQPLPQAA